MQRRGTMWAGKLNFQPSALKFVQQAISCVALWAPECLQDDFRTPWPDKLDADLGGELKNAVVPVKFSVDNAGTPSVGDELEAGPAGAGARVHRRRIDSDAVLRGLDDRVCLGMDGGHAVSVFHHVAHFVTVRQAADRAVVTGGENRPISHEQSADVLSIAGGSARHLTRNSHEVFVPRASLT